MNGTKSRIARRPRTYVQNNFWEDVLGEVGIIDQDPQTPGVQVQAISHDLTNESILKLMAAGATLVVFSKLLNRI